MLSMSELGSSSLDTFVEQDLFALKLIATDFARETEAIISPTTSPPRHRRCSENAGGLHVDGGDLNFDPGGNHHQLITQEPVKWSKIEFSVRCQTRHQQNGNQVHELASSIGDLS